MLTRASDCFEVLRRCGSRGPGYGRAFCPDQTLGNSKRATFVLALDPLPTLLKVPVRANAPERKDVNESFIQERMFSAKMQRPDLHVR